MNIRNHNRFHFKFISCRVSDIEATKTPDITIHGEFHKQKIGTPDDTQQGEQKPGEAFTITLDVVEPLGMETMIYFRMNDVELCGRVEPSSVTDAGEAMQLRANLEQMHLIDLATNTVI